MTAMQLEARYCAHNYEPIPVVLARGEGAHLWDTAGRRYVDMMSAYSAASHGHAHPRILAALEAQAQRLAVPSRAYYSDRLGPFLAEICRVTGLDAALPMNTGAEAVETAIKAARRWGYRVKGVAKDRAEIIVADGNFHGRTTTIISVFVRGRLSGRLWAVHAGLPQRAVRRYRRRRARDHAGNGGRADGADPGRGRDHRAAGRMAGGTASRLRRP
jgi:acetylornithine/succinyldiaminopimelate/putrescine aminotransferase